ncbi:SulP family inorganic anion transporter [Pendulispora albinea]|uniref:SLC26A/SulP transporter domain-containing protein n=1 Tax=Pendulispora albinea TaxID=2741071 RepID=A0ABZ2LVH4_9BACT
MHSANGTSDRSARAPYSNRRAESPLTSILAGQKQMMIEWASTWKEVIRSKSRGGDMLAGVTVAAVALPLNLALAVVSGLPPIAGLIAGSLGGVVAATFGGSPMQVTGPAAALSMMVLALATEFGPMGVAAATLIIGVVLLVLSALRAGKLAEYVPEAVLAGFTTGVGVKLLDAQIPVLLGSDYTVAQIAQMMHRPEWLHDVQWIAVVCGLFVAFLVTTAKRFKRFPAALVGIALVTFVSVYVKWDITRVGVIPSTFPSPSIPGIEEDKWLDLLVKTLPLALLAGVESLLSARAVDRMAGATKLHNPNLELFGQGLANLSVGLMSGMPVTGVIVRSGVNVQSGAKTRISAITHGLVLAGCVLYLSPYIAQIPLAALAGLLCVVGVRLIEVGVLVHLARTDKMLAAAFVVTCVGTVSGHLMMGLVSGLAIAWLDHALRRGERAAKAHAVRVGNPNLRAVVGAHPIAARTGAHPIPSGPEFQKWLSNIRSSVRRAKSSYVHKQANVVGRIVMEEHVHVAAGSSVRADEGAPFFIGANTNIQDGVVIHALKDKFVRVDGADWAVYVGKNVSIAHDALVHGPCFVGDHTFVGFKAVVHDSVVGPDCFIGIGAVVVGVEVPAGRFVPHGTIVDSAEKVAALPPVSEAQHEFNADVVEVNRGLVEAYQRQGGQVRRLGRRKGKGIEAGWFPPVGRTGTDRF